jgi:hypothetical protein
MNSSITSTAEKTRNAVLRSKKRVWTLGDFKTDKPGAVLRELSRLTNEGKLVRPTKGVYVRPIDTLLGPSTLSKEELAKVKATKSGAELVPTGYVGFNSLRITNQVSGITELATDRPVRVIDSAKARVRFVVRNRRTLKDPTVRAILEALRRINHISDAMPADVITAVIRVFKSKTVDFEKVARLALNFEPPRVRALVGAIGETLRVPSDVITLLHKSLNPTTTFQIEHGGSLRTASNWRIHS